MSYVLIKSSLLQCIKYVLVIFAISMIYVEHRNQAVQYD